MKNNIASAARAAFAIATAGCCLSLLAGNAANPVTNEIYPVPVPVSYSLDMDAPVPFDATTKVMVDCPDPAAAVSVSSAAGCRVSAGFTVTAAVLSAGEVSPVSVRSAC